MPVCVSTEVMRSSDRWTIENLCSSKELMERAGKAIFEQVSWKGPVGIICGKGNNAGDGFVVASLLKDHGIECEIVLLYDDSFSEDGKYFFDKCVAKGIPVVTTWHPSALLRAPENKRPAWEDLKVFKNVLLGIEPDYCK